MSYVITIICFGYLAFFGWKVKRLLKIQNIDYDESIGKETSPLISPSAEKAGVLQSEI